MNAAGLMRFTFQAWKYSWLASPRKRAVVVAISSDRRRAAARRGGTGGSCSPGARGRRSRRRPRRPGTGSARGRGAPPKRSICHWQTRARSRASRSRSARCRPVIAISCGTPPAVERRAARSRPSRPGGRSARRSRRRGSVPNPARARRRAGSVVATRQRAVERVRRRHDLDLARRLLAALRAQEHRRAVEVAARRIEVRGAHRQVERVDVRDDASRGPRTAPRATVLRVLRDGHGGRRRTSARTATKWRANSRIR